MRPSKRVLALFILAFLAALGAAFAEEAAAPAVAAGCGLNLEALASEAGTCPAVTPESAAPAFLSPDTSARQGYCRCGCGVRCSRDSDCGAGGSCVNFVTCC